ncbi:hypothetical protein [Thermanaerovibrio velox]|nr:hypothetical protein [Thermanaerovibrio velox]
MTGGSLRTRPFFIVPWGVFASPMGTGEAVKARRGLRHHEPAGKGALFF